MKNCFVFYSTNPGVHARVFFFRPAKSSACDRRKAHVLKENPPHLFKYQDRLVGYVYLTMVFDSVKIAFNASTYRQE